ncbi:MBOAT family O-acyltransferase [Desulfoluna butyratoxydans]|uniref:Membrane bound o-acyl transferase mboat n=1 Tax=Desulfoluna butyratoxydans TaxID=231438 RepID=A0A4U8YQV6_9BACT|nr:MBOAT family protein [Desulfoluna butyratoxydans]VFQ46094.1 membrane bound o-acyl transferase mboat [Desulfoluna butyratoxydans]
MLFYAPEFIFLFLPVALTGYFLLGRKSAGYARGWLLASSLVFYALGTSANLVLLLISIGANFYLARTFAEERVGSKVKKGLLWSGIVLNLGVLVYYKCQGLLFVEIPSGSQNAFMDILIPLGLSFFTLQQIAFLVDTYKGKIKETRLFRYALFVSFFPQLIAGPIVRYQELVPQLKRKETFRFHVEHLAVGSFVFTLGVLKKVLIADSLAPMVGSIFHAAAQGQEVSMAAAWLGSVGFYLQLYFDFSAYSDMALGIARMFGLVLPVNFDSPYRSRNLPQLFLRWHISLYRFLADYLMLPMMAAMKKMPLGSPVARTRWSVCTATLLTFSLSGLWHGASWNFLLWGVLNGVMMVLFFLHGSFFPKKKAAKTHKYWGTAATAFFCLFVSVVFRCQSLDQAKVLFKAMAGCGLVSLPRALEPALGWLSVFGIKFHGVFDGIVLAQSKWVFSGTLIMALGIAFACPNVYALSTRIGSGIPPQTHDESSWSRWYREPSAAVLVGMALGLALMISQVVDPGGCGSGDFIYFHF